MQSQGPQPHIGSANPAQSDGGRLGPGPRTGRMPRPPYSAFGVNPQPQPYDEEQAPPSASFMQQQRPWFDFLTWSQGKKIYQQTKRTVE